MTDTILVMNHIAQRRHSSFAEIMTATRVEQKKLYDILNVLEAVYLIEKSQYRNKATYRLQNGYTTKNPDFWNLPILIERK